MCLQERIHLEEYWILVEKIIMKMNDRKGNVESCLTGGVLQIHDSRVAGQPLLCQSPPEPFILYLFPVSLLFTLCFHHLLIFRIIFHLQFDEK